MMYPALRTKECSFTIFRGEGKLRWGSKYQASSCFPLLLTQHSLHDTYLAHKIHRNQYQHQFPLPLSNPRPST